MTMIVLAHILIVLLVIASIGYLLDVDDGGVKFLRAVSEWAVGAAFWWAICTMFRYWA